MKTEITITDLTRMQHGHVCIAGYDPNGICVRPVVPTGISASLLHCNNRPEVFPFAVVEIDLLRECGTPPHTEDQQFNPWHVRYLRHIDSPVRQREILDRTLFASVEAIFEQPILTSPGFYVKQGAGPRSLGTVQAAEITRLLYSPENGGKFRLEFVDCTGRRYRLAITDYIWGAYCFRELERGYTPDFLTARMAKTLKQREIYLRIGLARGWTKFPGFCFLQITGLYSFPPYFGSRRYADFIPPSG